MAIATITACTTPSGEAPLGDEPPELLEAVAELPLAPLADVALELPPEEAVTEGGVLNGWLLALQACARFCKAV